MFKELEIMKTNIIKNTIMGTIFGTRKSARSCHSISALGVLGKMKGLGLVACLLVAGCVQVWGARNFRAISALSELSTGDSVIIAIQDGATTSQWWAIQVNTSNNLQGSNSDLEDAVSDNTITNPYQTITWYVTKNSGTPTTYTFQNTVGKNTYYFSAQTGGTGCYTTLTAMGDGQSKNWYITNSSGIYFKFQIGSSTGRWCAASNTTPSKLASYATSSSFVAQVTNKQAICQFSYQLSVFKKEAGYAVTYNNGGHGTAPSNTTASAVTLSALTATGYTCTGWKANVAVTNTSTSASISAGTLIPNGTNVTLSQATTFTAQWSANTYTVTLNDNGGSGGSGSKTVTYNANTNLTMSVTVPTKAHHDFAGYWTSTDNGATFGTQLVNTDGSWKASVASYTDGSKNWIKADNVTLYAKWTEHALTNYRTNCGYSITYNCNGAGSGCPENIEYTFNLPNPLPSAPTKSGCEFLGWYTNSDLTVAAVAGAALSDDVTLYAKWCTSITAVSGKISVGSINETGGTATWSWSGSTTGISKNILKIYNTSDVLVKTIDNISASATSQSITGLVPCTEYYVTLTTVASSGYCDGEEQGTSDSFTTNGWAVHYEGGDEDEGALLSNVTKTSGASQACLSGNYVATFTANTGYDLPTTITVYIASSEVDVDDAYTWSISDGVGTLTVYTSELSEEIDVRIIGVAKTYTASDNLDKNGGDAHGQYTATYDATTIAINTMPTRTGYSVEGYYKEEGCTNKVATAAGVLQANKTYTDGSGKWIYTSAPTLFTKWSPNTNTPYTVKHYKQKLDGTYPASPDDTDNLTGTTAASVTPAVKSYTGFTAPSTQTVTILADGSLVVTYNYTRNSYTLEWALGGGSISSAGTAAGSVKYGASLTAPTVTKTGYTFSSWSPSVPATMPAANSTYTAQWSANTITITWNPNGAGATVSPTSSSYTYDGDAVEVPTPTRSLYAFDGWYTDASGGTQITEVGTTNKPTADVTYYAHWRALTFEVKDQAGTGTADIHLTSTNNVAVYATSACGNLITIKANNLDAISNLGGGTANKQNIQIKYLDANNGDAEVTGTDRVFRLCNDGIDPANYNNADGSNINLNGLTNYSHTYSISYTPSAYGVEDHYKLQLRLQNNNTEAITITLDLYGRALPEEFVVAAKKGDQWYALPNNILDNNRAVTPLKITVNDPSTPTAATYAPSEAVYKGTSRYASGTNVYGIRLTDPDGHWLQVSSSSGTNYVWVSGTGSSTCQDWKLNSSDFNSYTLTIPSSGAGDKKFGINNLGNIGYFASGAAGLCAEVYLLPITNKYTDIPATVHEWGEHGVIIQPTTPATLSSVTSATINVDTDDPTTATATAVNAAMGTAKYVRVYAAGVTVGGVANEGKQLYVHWKNSGGTEIGVSQVTIPCVIAEDATMSSIANTKAAWAAKSEVHILPGVTLDANAGSFAGSGPLSVSQMEIYPGATLKVSTGTFNATTLRLRCGWTRAGDKEYDVARVYINTANDAALTKTTASMDYDIYEKSDGKHYYPLAVPFKTQVSTIDYADEALASASIYGKHIGIDKYDGENRAESGATADNWVQMDESDYLEPGKGYTITAVSSKGSAIIRVPLVFDNGWTADGEKATIDESYYKNQVSVTAYSGAASTGGGANNRNAGWNMLGVPYMSCFDASDASSDPSDAFIKGKLNFITGAYTETSDVYVNVPVHDFSEYIQKPVNEAKLLPGWCFFVQFGKNGTLSFAVDGQEQSSSLPIYAPKREDMPEVKTGIILSNGDKSDQATLLISDKYSADEYEINADLEKMFGNGYTLATYSLSRDTRLAYNAMSMSDAKKVIPIGFRAPEDGEYTFALNPRYANAAVERVDLIDYQTGEVTNLMMSDYTFTSVRTQDDERFALNVVPMANMPTEIEQSAISGQQSVARKIVIDDHVYIIRNGQMFDVTGKRVKEINK